MVRLSKEKPEACPDPFQWIADGRWAGERRFSIQDHECVRATWFACRWATERSPAMKHLIGWQQDVPEIAKSPVPPEGLSGVMAELACPTCCHQYVCGGGAPARNCRTCRHVVPDGSWRCGVDGVVLTTDQQRAGCNLWEPAI